MGRKRATRLATLAVGLSLLGLAPFARFAHAETTPTPDPETVTGPVGVLLSGTDTGGDPPPVVEPPPPPPEPPSGEEPAPTPGTEPTRTPTGGGSGPSASAPPAASGAVRLPRAELTAIARPPAGGSGVLAPGARNIARTAGAGLSLEDIFLRDAVSATPQAVESAGRSALPIVGSSSLPAMLLKSMVAVLGMLLLVARRRGTSLTGATALGRTLHRRNAPRGWRIVVTTPLPAEPVVAPTSPLERPVLAPLEPVGSSAR